MDNYWYEVVGAVGACFALWAVARWVAHRLRRSSAILREISERKHIEDVLLRSEAYFAEAQKLSHVGSFSWQPSTGEISWSEEVFRIYGIDPGVKPTMELARQRIHPDDLAFFEEQARRVPVEAKGFAYEHRLLCSDGVVKHVRVMGRAIKDASNNVVEILGAVMDVTDQYQAQKSLECALKEMEALKEQFQVAIDTIPGLVWSSFPDGHIDFLNQRWRDYTGLTHPQASGWGWQSAIYHDDLAGLLDYWKSLLASKKEGEIEVRLRRFDGVYRWFLFRAVPLFDEFGKLVKWYGTNIDIDDRKCAEAMLAGEKRLLEMIARGETLEVTLHALCQLVEETNCGALCSILMVDPDDAHQSHFVAPSMPQGFVSEIDGGAIAVGTGPCASAARLKQLVISSDIQLDQRWSERYRALALEHGLRAAWSSPIVSRMGKVLGTIVIYFHEPTSPDPRQYGVIEQFSQLASIAIERTHADDALLQSERRLRQAHRLEAVGTLAGGIAHDFNNILGAILGYSEMALQDAPAGGRLRRDLDSIVTAGERGRALIERILAFSRSSVSEKVVVEVERVALEVLDLLSARLPEGIRIETKLHSGRAAILGGPTQIHQVLMNLMTNAIQAMPAGGTLHVALETARFDTPHSTTIGTLEARDYIVLEVADNGAGMSPEVLDRVFDPFFTTKGVGVGTGLGLSIVHGILTEMGGAINVTSKVDSGSRFTVYLPRYGDADDDLPRPIADLPRGNGEGILVVDDEEALAQLVTQILEELNYCPLEFTSSAGALAAFRADPDRFHAVITDDRMPGMSGSLLIHEIRGLRRFVPIILVSGYVSEMVMSRAYNEGANEVLKKPLSARELATSLARVLHPLQSE